MTTCSYCGAKEDGQHVRCLRVCVECSVRQRSLAEELAELASKTAREARAQARDDFQKRWGRFEKCRRCGGTVAAPLGPSCLCAAHLPIDAMYVGYTPQGA